jgi:uncharacterized membrane protein
MKEVHMSHSDMLESDILSVGEEPESCQKMSFVGFGKSAISLVSQAVFWLSLLMALLCFASSRGELGFGVSLQWAFASACVAVVALIIGLLVAPTRGD